MADVIGTKTDENYTYTLNSPEDFILTSTMVFTSDYSIKLDTENATGLTVISENEDFNFWDNDTTLSVNCNIEIDNIYLLNENLLTANTLMVSSTCCVKTFADNLVLTNGITNNGYIYRRW